MSEFTSEKGPRFGKLMPLSKVGGKTKRLYTTKIHLSLWIQVPPYHGPPKPTFLEVFMVNNLVFRWQKPLFFMVLGAHGRKILESPHIVHTYPCRNQAADPWILCGGINQAFWKLHPRVLLFEIPFVAHLSQEQNRRIFSIILVV